jgi:hypothetical protein
MAELTRREPFTAPGAMAAVIAEASPRAASALASGQAGGEHLRREGNHVRST